MHPLVRLGLKLASLPIFSVKKNYGLIRKAQEVFASEPPKEEKEDYILIDEYLLDGESESHLPIRVFVPKKQLANGLIIYIHGGGFVIGSVDSYTLPCARLATATGRVVCSVDYRLAPEFPFPAALEDCLTICREISGYFLNLGDPLFRPLTVMGDSAGANLATTVARLLNQEGEARRLDRQVLLYPAVGYNYGEDAPFPSLYEKGDGYGLTRRDMQEYYELYLGDLKLLKDPRVSPLLADKLDGLPPALLVTAEHDPLRDEGEYYAGLLEESGVPVRRLRYPDVPHGFFSHMKVFPESNQKLLNEVKAYLDAWPQAPAGAEARASQPETAGSKALSDHRSAAGSADEKRVSAGPAAEARSLMLKTAKQAKEPHA